MSQARFAGTATLIRLILRRDRLRLPIWILGLSLLPPAVVKAYVQLYPTPATRAHLDAEFGVSKALALITGPVVGLGTPGGFTQWRLGATLPAILALMAVFMVVRHTRAEEESGRAELVSAARVGRLASLGAALATTMSTCLVAGIVTTVALAGSGAGGAGAVAFGLGMALCGWVFAALAGVTAQLATYARTATGLASAAVAIGYLVRGIGDSTTSWAWLSWVSPIGWAQQLHAYTGERWWVLVVPLCTVVVLVGIAVRLSYRRDVGAGVIERSTGPAAAAPWLRSTWALALRTHRGPILGWVVGVAVFGAILGSLSKAVASIATSSLETAKVLEKLGGARYLSATFMNTIVGMLAMYVGFLGVSAVLRARAEETEGRAEAVLGTRVTRMGWVGPHAAMALGGTAVVMLVAGAAVGTSAALTDPNLTFGSVLLAALVNVPAVWIIAAMTILLIGVAPKLSGAGWGVAVGALLIALIGPIVNAPRWLVDISPFATTPKVVGASVDWVPVLVQLTVAAAALAAGLVGLRRRDIPS